MNTSHNKEKVVEHGWANVFKNVSRTSGKTKCSNGSEPMKQSHSKPSKLPYDKKKQGIFAISLSANNKVANKKAGSSQKVSIESEPCTSKGHKHTNKKHHTDVTTLNVNLLPQQFDKKQSILQRLIRNMIEHLNDEERYIEYFKEFVAHTDNQSDENATLEYQLNYELLPNYIPEDTSKDNHHKRKGKWPRQTTETPKQTSKPKLVEYPEDRNQLHNTTIFKGRKNDRIIIRRKILAEISACDEHEELYNALKEKLISAEESFVQ